MNGRLPLLGVLVGAIACGHASPPGGSARGKRPMGSDGGIREVRMEIRPTQEAMTQYGGAIQHELNATELALVERVGSDIAQELRALSRMARELAITAPDRYNVPPVLVDQLMAWSGLVHPPPRVIIAEIGQDTHGCAERPSAVCGGVIQTIVSQAKDAIGPLNDPVYGVGTARLASGAGRLLIVVLEPAVKVEPMPVSVELGQSTKVRGTLVGERSQPRIEMVDAEGHWKPLVISSTGKAFSASIPCTRPAGSLQIEVLAEGRHGPEVAANFPIYCGTTPPTQLEVIVERLEDNVTPEQIARANFDHLNAERRQRGLSALAWDDRAAEIAREHSADMANHDFVGHRSPTTGDVTDRFRRAELEGIVIRENVARGYGPQGIHDSLMRSPGHRINMLAEDVTHVGIGMVIAAPETPSPGVPRPVFATQNFFTPPGNDAPKGDLDVELRSAIDRQRKAAGLSPVKWDRVLSEEARRHAGAIADGREVELRATVQARIVELGAKGVDLHKVQTNAYEGLVQFALWQAALSGSVGLGVVRTGKKSARGFVLVVLVAS